MKSGDEVYVQFFGGIIEKRILLYNEENTVVICSVSEWKDATKENRRPEGIRIPTIDLRGETDFSEALHSISTSNA
jgi:uncharacterized protein with ACT and thioredoxin-like domain